MDMKYTVDKVKSKARETLKSAKDLVVAPKTPESVQALGPHSPKAGFYKIGR